MRITRKLVTVMSGGVMLAMVVCGLAGCGDSTVANNEPRQNEQRVPVLQDDRTDGMLVSEALAGSGSEAAVEALAARTSIEQNNPTREHLRKVFRESNDPQVRVAAIRGIAKGWDYDAMEDLLDALDDESSDVRKSAGDAVNKMIGLRFYYRADDPPEKRAAVVAHMRTAWRSMQSTGRLDNWLKRLPEVHEQLSPPSD